MADNKQIKEVVVVAGGGSEIIDVTSSVSDYRTYSASAITLAAAFNITATGTLVRGMVLRFTHDGGFTTDTSTGRHLSILGAVIPNEQALYEFKAEAYYDEDRKSVV